MDDLDDLTRLTPDLAALGWTDDHDRWAEGLVVDEEGTEALGTDAPGADGQGADEPGAGEPSAGDSGPDRPLIRGRLARVSRGFSVVFTGGDAVLAASGSARSRVDDAPATGDFVVVRDDPADGPVIAAIAPRTSALTRRAPGRVPEPQVLAANARSVLVMHGLDRPLNARRLERQLVVAWDSGAEPVVVLTKADLVDDATDATDEAAVIAPGVQVVAVSAETGLGLDQLRPLFDGGAAVAMLGLSGIGKSSLVNALSEGQVQRTGEVRAADRRGRHTTVTRDLIPLPDGGFVIDAPGVREIGLWQAYDGLVLAFPEIADAAGRCRFADCEHASEPGCEVRAGIERGDVDRRRIDHWQELTAELALQESQLEDFARRSESRDRAAAEDDRDGARTNQRSRRGGGGRRGRGRRR